MCEEFAKRRDLVYELISAIPGVKCIRPQGAFYLLCDVSSFGMTSEEFCNRLLAEEKLAAIPCCSFGAEGQIRLSYACSEANIRDAAGRRLDDDVETIPVLGPLDHTRRGAQNLRAAQQLARRKLNAGTPLLDHRVQHGRRIQAKLDT